MKEITKIKIYITILFAIALLSMFALGYVIGLDIGKQKGTSYELVLVIEPQPDIAESVPKVEKEGKI